MRSMQTQRDAHAPGSGRARPARSIWTAALTGSLLALSGCSLSPMAKHAVAFHDATRVVIDSSEDAYAQANRLHHDVMIGRAVADYDKNPQWSPYTDVKPLLTPDQLDARITVLEGLKMYAGTLVELTAGKPNPALSAAAAGVGSNVKDLSGTITKTFGGTAMDDTAGKAVSTATDALGQFLIHYMTQKSLKEVTRTMSPTVTSLCALLNSDVTVLRRQADVDYQTLLTDDDRLIRRTTVDPFTHREQVERLIDLAAQSKGNDELLAKLQTALHTLDIAHQALAAAAQGGDPDGIGQKITDLSAAGESLAIFYQSLSATKAANAGGKE
jgi:hypothetical protein